MLRLFVALALPDEVKAQLGMLACGIPGARWVPRENYHLTLRFIGEVEPWRAEEVDEALANIRARPFELSLRGVGTFEKGGRISALWVGVEKTEALAFLQGKVETALQRIGLEPERKRFAPHVTLARTERASPEKVIAYVQAHNLFRAPPVAVEHFTLYSSRLGKEAAVYVPEVEYELA
ncbi:RNA 2',3'-cyclic phosphodiesterase [Siccirubricoccus deserti]|uniref:RNA 2',3'-cyclic phosphodiesterase n=1 Tax=Siccirubricoccus deserti TaxID=2013562 RepID=A0A9X0QZK6_9PROT|nr:RNA 2',3'-cyclic phosphodiesterase [Siccirubricoccus deserti]MBC4016759.1 RNA 2',3'-cyclic phosphodiesterase [Siccirubricoccus deserti]GGC51543.1 RNA 2',3'-cyclic phosphodiesterase [Siccirubricoccus deserti]